MKNILITLFILAVATTLNSQINLNNQINNKLICPQSESTVILDGTYRKICTEPPCTEPPCVSPPGGGSNATSDRLVYFTHGLGGNSGSLSRATEYSNDTYKLLGFQPDYSQVDYTLSGTALFLHNNRLLGFKPLIDNDDGLEGEDCIIIGHSQGGLVSRALDWRYTTGLSEDRMFGGVVTFCSANGGAQILNNKQDIKDFGVHTCDVLLNVEIKEFLAQRPGLNLFVGGGNLESEVSNLCDVIINKALVPFAFDDLDAPIGDDFMVDAPFLNTLNTTSTPSAKVAFYGVEEDPLVWRTVHHFKEDPNDNARFYNSNPLEDEFIAKIDELTLEYEMQYLWYEGNADQYTCDHWWQWTFGAPACAVLSIWGNGYLDARDAWYEGWQWWVNIDDNWKTLIGAIDFEESTQSTGLYECICVWHPAVDCPNVEFTTITGIITDPNDCEGPVVPTGCNGGYYGFWDCFIIPQETTTYNLVEYESDGIVLAKSALAYPGANTGMEMGMDENRMRETSHMQARNHITTKEKLDQLFGGGNGGFFRTDPK